MILKNFEQLACPLDQLPLSNRQSQYLCSNEHCYDISRKGYVNLLSVQSKRSKSPGDNEQLVDARNRFLDLNLYSPLLQTVLEEVAAIARAACGQHLAIVDAGCGTGHFIRDLKEHLCRISSSGDFSLMGFDISKKAIQCASKKSSQITWAVATAKKIPIQTKSIDLICCLFGFPHFREFHRILKEGGKLLVIEPGKDHLIELRRQIYPEIKDKEMQLTKQADAFFQLQTSFHCKTALLNIASSVTADLINMTPHSLKARSDKLKALIEDPPQQITAEISLLIFKTRDFRPMIQ